MACCDSMGYYNVMCVAVKLRTVRIRGVNIKWKFVVTTFRLVAGGGRVKYVGMLRPGVLNVEIVHKDDVEQRVYIELSQSYDVACSLLVNDRYCRKCHCSILSVIPKFASRKRVKTASNRWLCWRISGPVFFGGNREIQRLLFICILLCCVHVPLFCLIFIIWSFFPSCSSCSFSDFYFPYCFFSPLHDGV